LIVDDEEALLKVAIEYLEDLGYKTKTATNAKQAIEMLQGPRQIDLVFSDVVMPGDMDGYNLGKAVLENHPGISILLTSGFTAKREKSLNGDNLLINKLSRNLLNKPYNQPELAVAIRRALDGKD